MFFNNSGNQNLIILCAGDNPAHNFGCDNFERNYDLLVIYYGNNVSSFKKKYNNINYFYNKQGYKFKLVKEYYYENEKIFKKYKNIFIPDDDLVFKTKDINLFFDIFNKNNLLLSQPSLIGYFSHAITLHKFEFILRYTNFIEIMMPCFSNDAFKNCVNSFDETTSGWGLDYLWPKLLGYPKNKIAIIDEVFGIHPRKVGSSELYARNKNINQEYDDFIIKNNLIKFNQEVYGSIKKDNFDKFNLEENYYPYSESFKNIFKKIKEEKIIFL